MEVRAIYTSRGDIDLYLTHDGGYAMSPTFVDMKHVGDSHPTGQISTKVAKALMDDLWGCGIRPTEVSDGSLGAMELHLADMRKIVFGRLGFTEADGE